MPSPVIKRSVVVGGHKTSVSLEDAFWSGLKEIAGTHRMTLSNLIGTISTQRDDANLSSAIRLYVLAHFRAPMTAASPGRAASDMIPEARHNAHDSFEGPTA
jgi:predicted DNA-binding ribbon-helix-helix protein